MKSTEISLTSDPQYASAAKKLREFEADLTATEQRFQALMSGGGKAATRDDAALLLAGKTLSKQSSDEAEELGRAIKALGAAIAIQKTAVREQQYRVSAELGRTLKPQYDIIVSRLAEALRAAAAIAREEHDFRWEADNAGVLLGTAGINPQPFRRLGRLDDVAGEVAIWLREAKESGHLK